MTALMYKLTGPVGVSISCEPPELSEVVDTALENCVEDIGQVARVVISSDPPHESSVEERGGRRFPLKNVEYIYRPSESLYEVRLRQGGIGIVDLEDSTVRWTLPRYNLSNPRSLFFLTVLDPLSLILPKQGVVVRHCAAVVRGSTVVLLFGQSGAGKSTISYLLGKYEAYEVLSDDVVFISFEGEREILVSPIHTGRGFVPQVMANPIIRKELSKAEILFRTKRKTYYRNPAVIRRKFVVKSMLFLEKNSDTYTTTKILSSDEVVRRLLALRTTIWNPYLEDTLHIDVTMARTIPSVELQYSNICHVPTIHNLLEELLAT